MEHGAILTFEREADSGSDLNEAGFVTVDKVESAVKRIVELASPVRVVAFGSRARGTHRPDSDLDLAVILRNFDSKEQPSPVNRSHLDAWMSIDLLVVGEERYEFMKESIVSVHHCIANEGVMLYDERTGSIDSGAIASIARR